MMGKIIDFPQKKTESKDSSRIAPGTYIWECNCGSCSFVLIQGGEIICDECEETQDLRHFDPTEAQPPVVTI